MVSSGQSHPRTGSQPVDRAEPAAPERHETDRIHAGEVSSQGRNTMGVRIIDLDADDRVGSIARVEAESPAPAETA